MFRILLIGLFSLGLLGCGYNATNPEATVPGKGKLTLANGQPARFCAVIFVPVAGKGGVQIAAKTNPDGTFTLKTGDKELMVPGEYMVVVKPAVSQATPEDLIEEIQASIPMKFQDDDNSPLIVKVKSEADLQIQVK